MIVSYHYMEGSTKGNETKSQIFQIQGDDFFAEFLTVVPLKLRV